MRVFVHAVAARKGKEGGATLLIQRTAEALLAAGPDNEYVFCLDQSLDLALPEQVQRIDVSLRNPRERIRWDYQGYRDLLIREGADVSVGLLGFGFPRDAIPNVCMLPDSTYFCAFRGFNRSPASVLGIEIKKLLLRQIVKRSAVVVVPSQAMADGVSADFGIRVPLRLLRYGWDSKVDEPSAKPWEEPVQILYISQLQTHKAHLNLIRLARALEDMDLDYQITICANPVDDPRLASQLRDTMRLRNLTSRFRNLTDVPKVELEQLFKEADCFVYPSLCESFGFPMVEAVSAGLPVVAAGTAINREMLGPGACYFPPLEPEIGAEKIRWLADHGLERAGMVMQAQEHQRRILPTWRQYGEELAAIIEAVVMGQ